MICSISGSVIAILLEKTYRISILAISYNKNSQLQLILLMK